MKTAVELLVEELKKSLSSVYNNEFDEEIKQALEMEKEKQEQDLRKFVDFINERHFNKFTLTQDEVDTFLDK
jgi:trehalose-6-phosphate synthase